MEVFEKAYFEQLDEEELLRSGCSLSWQREQKEAPEQSEVASWASGHA